MKTIKLAHGKSYLTARGEVVGVVASKPGPDGTARFRGPGRGFGQGFGLIYEATGRCPGVPEEALVAEAPTTVAHSEVRAAFEVGAEIEWRPSPDFAWEGLQQPAFFPEYEYRVKPPVPGEHLCQAGCDAFGPIWLRFGLNSDGTLASCLREWR